MNGKEKDDLNPKITTALDALNGLWSIEPPRYAKPTYNPNIYNGECVSFVKRFTEELGVKMNPMGGNGGAKYGFINFNKPGSSLSAEQADKIRFSGSEQPKIGDIIFFDSTPTNKWGHVGVVSSVFDNGSIEIQESNLDGEAPNTQVKRRRINNLSNTYPGRVMGWLRLKL